MNHAQKKKALQEKVVSLTERGLDLAIHFANEGWRLTNGNQSEYISPRLSYSEMVVYLDGYSAAVARAFRHGLEMSSRFDIQHSVDLADEQEFDRRKKK